MLIRNFLRIAPAEAEFARRGFSPGRLEAQLHLEKIGCMFLSGYNAAIESPSAQELERSLLSTDVEFRGFAFEGAAMALSVLDNLIPWRRGMRFDRFLRGVGEPHSYMVLVGAGWSYARIPFLRYRLGTILGRLDPLFRWLAVDGFGFHEGYFFWPKAGEQGRISRAISGYARRAFDQGLGRSAWFACCADGARVTAWMKRVAPSRRGDLWSGIGLACAYAGGGTENDIAILRAAAQEHRPDLAQGAAFAAKARIRAGNLVAHTERVCQAFCGISAREAAAVTDSTMNNLTAVGSEPAFEVWRGRIRREFRSLRVAS
jgi:hypothetical protein